MAKIKQITAFEILDSRGNPTIETTVVLDDGSIGIGAVPSGASVGGYEAVELRDHDMKHYHGLGVLKAIENVEQIIAPKLVGMEANNQAHIDKTMIELDATPQKSKLGANAILSVSIAVAKAQSLSEQLPLYAYLRKYIKSNGDPLKLPIPMFNLINGGLHGGGNTNIQEYLVIPATSKTYSEALHMGISVYKSIIGVLKQRSLQTTVGDEGGYAPLLSTNTEALTFLKQAILTTSIRLGFDVFLGIDAAANNFYQAKQYRLKDKAVGLSANDLISFYQDLYQTFRLLYIEDPLSENDFEGWSKMYASMSHDSIIVGDDLVSTNPYRLQMAIEKKAISGVIIKPNQIGTVIETLAVVEMAKAAGLKIIVSHRSAETNDDFIADLAVSVSADYAKFGAPARGERVCKYNRLLRIEKELRK